VISRAIGRDFFLLDVLDFFLFLPEKDTIVFTMEQNINNCLNTNIYSYLETSGGQSSNLYLHVVHFSTPVLIRKLWQLKTVVFMHSCLICIVPLECQINYILNPKGIWY
jgi:hypothetical protein